ncbi:MAG: polyprenyl synthetase family protein [Acidobacteriota bacterium]
MFDLDAYLSRQGERIHASLDRLVPPETEEPSVIHRSMRYSLFAGGKRVRPILAIAAAEALGCESDAVLAPASALEMVHTYSLIHDDLPALDNDDLRRGRPTNHKVFGDAMAILAGDALLTLAFQALAQSALDAPQRLALVEELSVASGTVRGMIGGQVEDLEGEHKTPSAELLDKIHRAKTGALLRASVRFGSISAGHLSASPAYESLSHYGESIGLAFQIVDDLLDIESTPEQLGKTPGKDAAQNKITFPAVYGAGTSRHMAEEHLAAAHAALQPFGERAAALGAIANLIVHRNS